MLYRVLQNRDRQILSLNPSLRKAHTNLQIGGRGSHRQYESIKALSK